MKLKLSLIALIISAYICNAQDWKQYPYTPSGSLISFSADEGRHLSEPIEWWYTAGHITGNSSAKEYSYMLTYFYYPDSGFDGFRILNLTDHSDGTFYQNVLPVNYTTLSTTELNIEADVYLAGTETWKNKLDGGNNIIPFEYDVYANGGGVTLDFELATLKRPLILGDDGYLDQGSINYTYYYSQTGNDLTGSLTVNGTTETVAGTAWIDRQYGDFNPLTGENYEWFSLQLSNGMDINLWNIFTANHEIPNTNKFRILSAYVNETTQYTSSSFNIERLAFFCTPDEVNCYAQQWRLTSTDQNNIDLIITSMHQTTEVTLPFRFYEGATTISGTINGNAVTGVGFTELLHHYEHPEMMITSPTGGVYNTSMPITWELNNPDDGRPITYNLEYSVDNQNTFLPIAQGLTTNSYTWANPPISESDEVWFKITGKSIDDTLTGTVISSSSSTVTLSLEAFNPNGIKLYPNPSRNEISIEFKEHLSDLKIEIIDVRGRVMFENKAEDTALEKINISTFPQGVYFIRIHSETVEDFLRFVKK
jgi:predicted secreted hydrolase